MFSGIGWRSVSTRRLARSWVAAILAALVAGQLSPVAAGDTPPVKLEIMPSANAVEVGDAVIAGGDVVPEKYASPRGFSVIVDIDDPMLAERAFPALAKDGKIELPLPETFWGARFGAVHVLCNTAGIAVLGPRVGADPGEWRKAMDVNFWGVVHGIDAFLPRMLAQGAGGHVVNTSSMAGLVGMQGFGIYCATKFAVVGLSESLRRELEPRGIGVSVLCPMMVDTRIGENSARALGRLPRARLHLVRARPPRRELP